MSFSKVSLREAFWFQEGPGVRKWQFTTSGIKLLNVANIVKDGSINLSKTDRHLSEEEVDSKYSHFLADPGDLVIASSGISIDDDGFLRTRGAFVDKCHLPLCMNTSTIRFKSLNGVSELAYLRHWLQSFEFRSQITREVTGIAQKNFGPSHLKRLRISLPPLAEQKRIAGILDAADALRAKRREALAQLDTLIQSTFLDMFGDPVTNPMGWDAPPLADFCQTGTGGTPSRGKMQRYYEGGTIPWVKSGELREEVIAGTGERITETALKETNVKLVPKDALLLALYGATVGRLGILGIQATTNQAVCHIIPNSLRADFRYVFHSLSNQVSYLVGRGVGGAQPNISQGIVKSLAIPLPPLNLQHRFAAIAESVKGHKARQRAHLAELDTLFASLQSRAFRGDL